MIISSSFKPAWWLANAHAQTVYASLTRREVASIDAVERVELPDGDFIDLAWAIQGLGSDTPLVIFLHGLGGSISSTYVAGQLKAYNRRGWRAVFMHFRGASQEPNRLLRAYHSGDTADLNYVLNHLSKREPHTKKAIVGFSMGGNILLKWLAEQRTQSIVSAAVAVSVPFQLALVTDRVLYGFSRVYKSYLLRRMRRVFDNKFTHYPDLRPIDWPDMRKLRDLVAFDERITAPINGFANAEAYYNYASSRQYLHAIATPTLIIHSLDDPFMVPSIVPQAHELSESVTLELSKHGGHVGFITGNVPGRPKYWLDMRVPEYLQTFL